MKNHFGKISAWSLTHFLISSPVKILNYETPSTTANLALMWEMCAILYKNMADFSQLILSLILAVPTAAIIKVPQAYLEQVQQSQIRAF